MAGFTPLQWWKESWREACEEVDGKERRKQEKAREALTEADGCLSFRENREFFSTLDQLMELGETVRIRFDNDRPDKDSKIWPRLRQCQNWSEIEAELERVRSGQNTPLRSVMSSSMAGCLTGGEIILIAWIATLVAAVLFYAVYKGYKARLKVNRKGEGEIELDPA